MPDDLTRLVDLSWFANKRTGLRRDALAERAIAFGAIVAGTLLNGYGSPLVRWLESEM